jgi:hypothetical protein
MDPEEHPVNEQHDDESESSDAESDQGGRDTDVSESWGALPATTQQVNSHMAIVILKNYQTGLPVRQNSCRS